MDKRIRFCILLFLVLVAVKEMFSENNRCVGRKCSRAASPNLRLRKRAASLRRTLRNDDEVLVESIAEDYAEGEWAKATTTWVNNLPLDIEPLESGTFIVCVHIPPQNRLAGNNDEGSHVYFRLKGMWEESYTPETLFSSNEHAVTAGVGGKSCNVINSDNNFPRRPLKRLKWKNVGSDGIQPISFYVCKKGDDNYKYQCPWECESGWDPECYKRTSSEEYEQTTKQCVRVSGDACLENWYNEDM